MLHIDPPTGTLLRVGFEPTRSSGPADLQSAASASSATGAGVTRVATNDAGSFMLLRSTSSFFLLLFDTD